MFEVTTLIIILGFAVAAMGMRFYVRLQYILFAGSAISALTLLGVLATTSHAQFVSKFNSFVAPLIASGNQSEVSSSSVAAAGGYYQYIINTANLGSSHFQLVRHVSPFWCNLAFLRLCLLEHLQPIGNQKVGRSERVRRGCRLVLAWSSQSSSSRYGICWKA